ncbi:DUF1254 domain-containing protein [Altererythrobacter sp. ZODW24]|uniref:DUF1254 domain-containing protein n=1 Tax=Altererythrobacter sp. ZODW24 TaxID=2185142 RepID=UPI000DF73870|nr:DUF1254 domain-containing protein [Altererythrobacter sp. ZODW24]
MKRLLGPLALAVIAALAGHFLVLQQAPSFIMDRALVMLEQRGIPLHGFQLAERMTPETQSVVRPSPDLAYSACRFDFDEAPDGIKVRMAATPDYASLSFFDANTNNFLTLRGEGETRETILLPPGSAEPPEGSAVSPTTRGVILIRRLAPTQEAYDAVAAIAAGDACETI